MYDYWLVVGSFDDILELESLDMLKSLCDRNNNVEFILERYAASIVFTLTYGKRLGKDDRDLRAVLNILDGILRDCTPGAHLVDTLPVLDLLPDFLAPWRAEARRKHEKDIEVCQILTMSFNNHIDLFFSSMGAFCWKLNIGWILGKETPNASRHGFGITMALRISTWKQWHIVGPLIRLSTQIKTNVICSYRVLL